MTISTMFQRLISDSRWVLFDNLSKKSGKIATNSFCGEKGNFTLSVLCLFYVYEECLFGVLEECVVKRGLRCVV